MLNDMAKSLTLSKSSLQESSKLAITPSGVTSAAGFIPIPSLSLSRLSRWLAGASITPHFCFQLPAFGGHCSCSCSRDSVGYCYSVQRGRFGSGFYTTWGCGFTVYFSVALFLLLLHYVSSCLLRLKEVEAAQGDTDPTAAMATTTTTTHSRILACTAMVFLLLTTSISGAQGRILRGCPCGETYVVRGGESLQMISEKCNDQFILENNPHIVDHDDLFEGQFLKMDCTQRKINLCDITGALPAYFC